MSLVPFNIISRSFEQFSVIFSKTEHHIAILAKQFSHGSGNVTMIDSQRAHRFFIACTCGFWLATKSTHTILTRKHLIVLCYGQVELLAELAHSPLLGVPYTLVFRWWMRFAMLFPICHLANFAGVPDTKTQPRTTISGKCRKRFLLMTRTALLCLVWCWYLLFVPSVLAETHLASGLLLIGILSVSSKVSKGLCFVTGIALFLRRLHKVECALGKVLRYTITHERSYFLSSRRRMFQHRFGTTLLPPQYTTNPPVEQVYRLFKLGVGIW